MKKKRSKLGAASFELLIMFPLWATLILMCITEVEYASVSSELEQSSRIALRIAVQEETENDAISILTTILDNDDIKFENNAIKIDYYTFDESSLSYIHKGIEGDNDLWKKGNIVEIKVYKLTDLYNDGGELKWENGEYNIGRTKCVTVMRMLIENQKD